MTSKKKDKSKTIQGQESDKKNMDLFNEQSSVPTKGSEIKSHGGNPKKLQDLQKVSQTSKEITKLSDRPKVGVKSPKPPSTTQRQNQKLIKTVIDNKLLYEPKVSKAAPTMNLKLPASQSQQLITQTAEVVDLEMETPKPTAANTEETPRSKPNEQEQQLMQVDQESKNKVQKTSTTMQPAVQQQSACVQQTPMLTPQPLPLKKSKLRPVVAKNQQPTTDIVAQVQSIHGDVTTAVENKTLAAQVATNFTKFFIQWCVQVAENGKKSKTHGIDGVRSLKDALGAHEGQEAAPTTYVGTSAYHKLLTEWGLADLKTRKYPFSRRVLSDLILMLRRVSDQRQGVTSVGFLGKDGGVMVWLLRRYRDVLTIGGIVSETQFRVAQQLDGCAAFLQVTGKKDEYTVILAPCDATPVDRFHTLTPSEREDLQELSYDASLVLVKLAALGQDEGDDRPYANTFDDFRLLGHLRATLYLMRKLLGCTDLSEDQIRGAVKEWGDFQDVSDEELGILFSTDPEEQLEQQEDCEGEIDEQALDRIRSEDAFDRRQSSQANQKQHSEQPSNNSQQSVSNNQKQNSKGCSLDSQTSNQSQSVSQNSNQGKKPTK